MVNNNNVTPVNLNNNEIIAETPILAPKRSISHLTDLTCVTPIIKFVGIIEDNRI